MKRIVLFLAAALLLLAFFPGFNALADNEETLPYVTDAAELLSDSNAELLNQKAAALTEKYGIAVRILTVNSIGEYNIEDFAEAVFDQYHLGYGDQNSCIMLLLSMEYRDYDIFAHGYGNYAFTDYGKDKIANHVVPKMSNGDWYGAFIAFLEDCGDYLEAASRGEPIDRPGGGGGEMPRGTRTLIHVIIGLVPALIATMTMKGKMKTVHKQRSAAQYTGWDQLDLRVREDRFVHRSVHRTRIETNSGSRGGGGGTSVNSHGSSHHSGKF